MTGASALQSYRQATRRSLLSVGQDLGVNKSTILRWELTRVPAEKVLDVERATGVPRHALRPDLFPRPADPETLPASATPHHETVDGSVA
jgi:DNA-binding transcriptional regulator YdaS (Cro superfamily)